MVNRLDESVPVRPADAPASRRRVRSLGAEKVEGAVPEPRARPTSEELFALVYAQVRKLAGTRDVEEIAQQAAEHVIRGLPKFEGRSELSTWTYRICYLTIRKHDRWYRRWLRRFTLTRDGELPERPAEGGSDEGLEKSERRVRLELALEQLSPKRRAVIVLHDMEGLSVVQIAGIVGAEVVAVRSRLRDARTQLGAILADDPYFGDEACASARRRKR